ncbi:MULTISPECIES: chemotaxis protein CheW [Rhodopirellula]|uniref:CheW protein n=1 Tax=Rhodopirellula sallentina SM41 TaxID=1263870 RepID=M5U5Q9_9BACT|nr:chemotaxis protein CheW [Rhodopirellula sallentina]EMI56780.1 CheW protein [Rhodopirellula sallentina SM41]
MIDDDQICTFSLDKQVFGIEVKAVQEVIRYQNMTEVPLADESVCGLINLRGQIVTAVDLRTRLGLPDRASDQLPMNIIVRGDSGSTTSFLVDSIGEVKMIDPKNFERTPGTLGGVASEIIRGAYKTDDELILILDRERAMNVSLN